MTDTDYSPEPPRRELVRQYTFNFSGDDAIDLSPQSVDGTIDSGVSTATTGRVGRSASFNGNTDATITAASAIADERFATAAVWVYPTRLDESRAICGNGVHQLYYDNAQDRFAVEVTDSNGTTSTVHSNTVPEADTWYHLAWRYAEQGELQLFVDGIEEGGTAVDNYPLGSATTVYVGEDTIHANFAGQIDDVRYYRTDLTDSHIHGLYEIGSQHNSVGALGDNWQTDGIPFRGTNKQLAGTLGEEVDAVQRQLDAIREARHINDAGGEQLDAIGQINGIRRKEGESDDRFRSRIIGILSAARSSGTFSDILEATASVLDTTIDRIEIREAWQNDSTAVATAHVYIAQEPLDKTSLTKGDISTILQDVVIAGHDIEVFQLGTFTLINDAMVSDAANGLTSDTISTGGTLASDL